MKSCALSDAMLSNALQDEPIIVSKYTFPTRQSFEYLWIAGSVNDIFLVVAKRGIEQAAIFIKNLSTHRSKYLPSCEFKTNHGCYVILGLGYVEANNDYMVHEISCLIGYVTKNVNMSKIYSWRTNKWKITWDPIGSPEVFPQEFTLDCISNRKQSFHRVI
ncbi:hypothetical protein L1887_01900 [Cichorium endivia]|nr:hypothetical protein L1887_01900 [Cichorium endivia]